MVEEGEVEAKVVTDEHSAADELQEGGQHFTDAGRSGHHGVGDAGQRGDEGRDSLVGPYECLVGAEHLAAPVAGGGHLGERRKGRGAARGLDVQYHEGHLMKGGAKVIEGPLPLDLHRHRIANIRSSWEMCCPDSGDYRVVGDH